MVILTLQYNDVNNVLCLLQMFKVGAHRSTVNNAVPDPNGTKCNVLT